MIFRWKSLFKFLRGRLRRWATSGKVGTYIKKMRWIFDPASVDMIRYGSTKFSIWTIFDQVKFNFPIRHLKSYSSKIQKLKNFVPVPFKASENVVFQVKRFVTRLKVNFRVGSSVFCDTLRNTLFLFPCRQLYNDPPFLVTRHHLRFN